jgi:hypothetical protein
MIFRPEAKEHLNPDPEKGNFDLDDVKNLGFITSMKLQWHYLLLFLVLLC